MTNLFTERAKLGDNKSKLPENMKTKSEKINEVRKSIINGKIEAKPRNKTKISLNNANIKNTKKKTGPFEEGNKPQIRANFAAEMKKARNTKKAERTEKQAESQRKFNERAIRMKLKSLRLELGRKTTTPERKEQIQKQLNKIRKAEQNEKNAQKAEQNRNPLKVSSAMMF